MLLRRSCNYLYAAKWTVSERLPFKSYLSAGFWTRNSFCIFGKTARCNELDWKTQTFKELIRMMLIWELIKIELVFNPLIKFGQFVISFISLENKVINFTLWSTRKWLCLATALEVDSEEQVAVALHICQV